MVMQPKVLILDEPTSQLDPIAASEFLKVIYRINRELGTTVIISEHRLEELFTMADRVMVMDGGKERLSRWIRLGMSAISSRARARRIGTRCSMGFLR